DLVAPISLQPASKQLWVSDCYTSTGYLTGTGSESQFDVFVGLHTSPEINLQSCMLGDRPQNLFVDDLLCLRPIKINQMKSPYAGLFKLTGHLQWMVTVFFFLRIIPLGEADTLAADDVYCRNNLHYKFKKLVSIFSPLKLLFSGCACMA